MPNYEKLTENLTRRGYTVRRFAAAQQAADYLDSVIDQTSVAFGGSVTLDQLDLYPRLSAHNRCLWHWKGDDRMDGMQTEVYLSSVNGLAETGELINIDGLATGWPPPCSATSGSISWWGPTRSPRTTTPPCGGPGTSPPPKTPSA